MTSNKLFALGRFFSTVTMVWSGSFFILDVLGHNTNQAILQALIFVCGTFAYYLNWREK
jgi:hypothetical protein